MTIRRKAQFAGMVAAAAGLRPSGLMTLAQAQALPPLTTGVT